MALKPDYGSLQKFFIRFNSFQVPYYQRNYVWAKPENEFVLKKFIQDITDEYDSNLNEGKKTEYFIGNCALYTRNSTYIIDGAQRVSTIIILLAELAKLTHSDKISFFSNGHFIMNGGSKVSYELQHFVFDKTDPAYRIEQNCAIALAQRYIASYVQRLLILNSLDYLKGLEDYILNNIYVSYITFETEREALKYFLNINSLSIQLTEMEIFCAFVSQLITYTNNTRTTIERVKEQIKNIDERLGSKVSDEDIVFVFLNAYFKNDNNIGRLRDKKSKTGIGKWLTGYKMELLSNSFEANKFIEALANYIADIDNISTYFIGTNANTTSNKFIWFISIFNKYTKNVYLNDLFVWLFKNRHNYIGENIYVKGTNVIDEKKLDSYCKAAASVIVIDYFKGKIKDISRNDDKVEIKLSERTENKQNAILTLKNLSYQNIWNLKYPIDRQDTKYSISNDYESIFFILALQEAYLNSIANPAYNGKMMNIFAELLDPNQNYQIEHLITKEDWTREVRRNAWKEIGMFSTPAEYDEFRARFENLSILDGQTNSSASSDTVANKFKKYKNARTIMNTNEPEYLIQSLVNDSDFYNNDTLKNIGERKISVNSNGITWVHSENNRQFIEALTKSAIQELFK